MTDPLDWQILDDKAPEELEPTSAPPFERPTSRKHWWWIGGVVAAGALAATGAQVLLSPSRETQLHTTVLAVVAAEPRLSPIAHGIAALGPVSVDAIDASGDGRIQATLSYTATDVEGQTLRFGLERSLVTEGALLASDPDALDARLVTLTGSQSVPQLELTLLTEDRDFIEGDILPYLDEVARRACEIWVCPDWTSAHLALTQMTPGAGEQPLEPLANSWMLAGAVELADQVSVELPAPALAGRPADATTLDSYRRRLALRLLPLLARSVVEGSRQLVTVPNNSIVADALATRTAVLLGLEPNAVAAARPADDDAGLINDSPEGRSVLTERALLRLNAFLGEPGSALERELWARLEDEPDDVIATAVDLAHRTSLPPEEALSLVWGGGLTRAVVAQLTRPDWMAQLACVDGVHVAGAQGHAAVRWDTLSTSRVLEVGPLSEDGAFQALVFAGQPLLLDSATGRLWWMVWPDPVPGRSPRFGWDDTPSFSGVGVLGAWTAQIKFDPRYASLYPTRQPDSATYRWEGRPYRVSLPDTTGSDTRVFRAQQVIDATGAVVADWGQAAWPSRNPRTGEIAVLSRVEDPARAAEYRITVYANPTDAIGRVVWRSSEFGWSADQPLAWAAVQWIGDTHSLVGIVRPVNEDHYVPLPVIWRTDPDAAQSIELPTLKLSSSTIFDFSVSADGQYVALVSSAAQGPGTRTSIVSTTDGELVNAFDLPGGLLTWAPSGHVFAFQGGGHPQVYAHPEDHAPIWSLGDTGCASLVWRPAQTLNAQSSVSP